MQGVPDGIHPVLHVGFRIGRAACLRLEQFLLASQQFSAAFVMLAFLVIFGRRRETGRLEKFRRIGQKRARIRMSALSVPFNHCSVPLFALGH